VIKNPLILIFGLCAAGLASGIATRRLTQERPPSPVLGEVMEIPHLPAVTDTRFLSPSLPSTETLESLLAPDDSNLYARLAVWLLDASEPNIAAIWASYQDAKRNDGITDLILMRWTRLNPQAAVAAVAGSRHESRAWWAWACHDPQAALTAALSAGSEQVKSVAVGIGEFHPDWLRAHLTEIPEAARNGAVAALTKGKGGEKPLETLEFLKQNGSDLDSDILNALIRKDPSAAFAWLQESPETQTNHFDRNGDRYNPMDVLLATMSEEHPDELQHLADRTPAGELKRKMEAAQFAALLKTDPDAAIRQAKSTIAPRIAAERLAAAGLGLVKTDPDRAREIANSLFGVFPDALGFVDVVEYPNGSSHQSPVPIPGAKELMTGLVAIDPAKALETSVQSDDGSTGVSARFYAMAQQWAQEDPAAYSKWVNQQSDPDIRDAASGVIIYQLQSEHQYAAAAQWAVSSEKTKTINLPYLFQTWMKEKPDEAAQWLETADLPAAEKTKLKTPPPENPSFFKIRQ
jgi:hypothetical protein